VSAIAALATCVASLAVWVAGSLLSRRVALAAIARLPSSWHERFGDDYEEFAAVRLRDWRLGWADLVLAAAYATAFLVLSVAGVRLGVQLGAGAAYSAWATHRERAAHREETARLVDEEGLERPPTGRRRGHLFTALVFATWLGFVSAACFLAWAIVEAVSGA
jgi:hypothetical protein